MALVFWGSVACADWTLQRISNATGSEMHCHLQSDIRSVSDGYQETHVSILVQADAVLVKTAATLDASFSDIGMQIDKHAFLPMDDVYLNKIARFASHYDAIINQFRKGYTVSVQLRFWPTWPAMGSHSVSFNLIGFSKAYAEMLTCPR
jgi:hypothetical protein